MSKMRQECPKHTKDLKNDQNAPITMTTTLRTCKNDQNTSKISKISKILSKTQKMKKNTLKLSQNILDSLDFLVGFK